MEIGTDKVFQTFDSFEQLFAMSSDYTRKSFLLFPRGKTSFTPHLEPIAVKKKSNSWETLLLVYNTLLGIILFWFCQQIKIILYSPTVIIWHLFFQLNHHLFNFEPHGPSKYSHVPLNCKIHVEANLSSYKHFISFHPFSILFHSPFPRN